MRHSDIRTTMNLYRDAATADMAASTRKKLSGTDCRVLAVKHEPEWCCSEFEQRILKPENPHGLGILVAIRARAGVSCMLGYRAEDGGTQSLTGGWLTAFKYRLMDRIADRGVANRLKRDGVRDGNRIRS
jgi:hypothetical protein